MDELGIDKSLNRTIQWLY